MLQTDRDTEIYAKPLDFSSLSAMMILELEQNVRQAPQTLAREDLIHSEVEFQAQKHAETKFDYLILDL